MLTRVSALDYMVHILFFYIFFIFSASKSRSLTMQSPLTTATSKGAQVNFSKTVFLKSELSNKKDEVYHKVSCQNLFLQEVSLVENQTLLVGNICRFLKHLHFFYSSFYILILQCQEISLYCHIISYHIVSYCIVSYGIVLY